LTNSVKKTNTTTQDTESLPAITINNYQLDVVKEFTYLSSTMTDNLSMDFGISRRIGRVTTTLARLSKRVWYNAKLTVNTKMTTEPVSSWTLFSRQERRVNMFHLRRLRRILGIKWSDRITNNEVLRLATTPSIFTLLRACDNIAFAGWDTSAGCRAAGSARTYCMANSQQARELRAVPDSDSEMTVKET